MLTPRLIHYNDSALHRTYCSFVRKVFPRAGFERWIDWGEWNADYGAFALFDGEQIIANASLTRMRLLLNDRESAAWQIGAVGVLPERRGHGYADQVLNLALQACGDDPVMLFANPNVRDFYPRFGFRSCGESLFEAGFTCQPAQLGAPLLDLEQRQTRALIHHLAETGVAATRLFGVRGHGRTLSWYLANGFALSPRKLDENTLVVCSQDGDCLNIDDILSTQYFDLAAAIPRLITSPISRIRFGFTPELWWPAAQAIALDDDAHLFVRGFVPAAPHRFPILART